MALDRLGTLATTSVLVTSSDGLYLIAMANGLQPSSF